MLISLLQLVLLFNLLKDLHNETLKNQRSEIPPPVYCNCFPVPSEKLPHKPDAGGHPPLTDGVLSPLQGPSY